MHYHPGALFRNKWSCCKQYSRSSLGCQPTYHLLTRSSSRYAQMRRKDTLTSSQNSSRWSKSGSLHRADRSSIPPDTHIETGEGARATKTGRGLSNSCVDLTHRHVQNKFVPPSPGAGSHCSSLLSNEASISMGSITLTRLSLPETASPTCPQPRPKEASRRVQVLEKSHMNKAEAKKRSSRSQVAPESPSRAPPTHFPSSESHPDLGDKMGTAHPVLPQRFTHSASTQFTRSLQLPPTTSSHSPTPVRGGYHCLTEPRRIRHSKTFMDAVSPSVRPSNLSSSLIVLPPKPVIEPKVSTTDPNIIHV